MRRWSVLSPLRQMLRSAPTSALQRLAKNVTKPIPFRQGFVSQGLPTFLVKRLHVTETTVFGTPLDEAAQPKRANRQIGQRRQRALFDRCCAMLECQLSTTASLPKRRLSSMSSELLNLRSMDVMSILA